MREAKKEGPQLQASLARQMPSLLASLTFTIMPPAQALS